MSKVVPFRGNAEKKTGISWKLQMHIAGEKHHSLLYRAEHKGKGVQLEIYTPVRAGYDYFDPDRFGKAKTSYFIDGVEAEFTSEEELIEALGNES